MARRLKPTEKDDEKKKDDSVLEMNNGEGSSAT
jgi:hypothetical protein